MGSTAELIKKPEVKICIVFALLAMFTVMLVGIFNRIEFFVIVKRIIISEPFFIPIGMAVGYIYRSILKPIMDQLPGDADVGTIVDERIGEEGEDGEAVVPGPGGNKDFLDAEESVINSEGGSGEGPLKEEDLSKSDVGKNIIVDDIKIPNKPKLMAKAVRTMMNKEE